MDYSSNVYSEEPPAGGVDATQLHVYMAWLNQSEWNYDPLYQSWWRYVDDADLETAGQFHPEIDRLTGRQLHFENVIVLFAKHDVISPTNLDIHLEQDWVGDAFLFRDGKKYKIRWSTVATPEEVQSGRRKPIRFSISMTRHLSRSSRVIHGSWWSHPKQRSPKNRRDNGCCSLPSRRGQNEINALSGVMSIICDKRSRTCEGE